MKPIIKKYASKDLNIAYNDGYETGRKKRQIQTECMKGNCKNQPMICIDCYEKMERKLEAKRRYWENKYKKVMK